MMLGVVFEPLGLGIMLGVVLDLVVVLGVVEMSGILKLPDFSMESRSIESASDGAVVSGIVEDSLGIFKLSSMVWASRAVEGLLGVVVIPKGL